MQGRASSPARVQLRQQDNGIQIHPGPLGAGGVHIDGGVLEAALSPTRMMSLLVLIRNLVKKHSQFIIATHSPILMAYPGACIYQLSQDGIDRVAYRDTEHYQLTRRFLEAPERMIELLFREE